MIEQKRFFCSWSGGKDSCLAMYHAIRQGGIPACLLTMMVENGKRSRSHGLSLKVLQAQSERLGLPLITSAVSWGDYEKTFSDKVKKLHETGIEYGVFGDIDIEDHRQWCRNICFSNNISAIHPLWKKARKDLLIDFIDSGFKAMIVTVRAGILSDDFLGKTIDRNLVELLEDQGIDAAGENGEYHSVVTDGPIFSSPLSLRLRDRHKFDDCIFQDISLSDKRV